MNFVHYTSREHYSAIQCGSEGYRGLLPCARVVPKPLVKSYGMPTEAAQGAIYGLLVPLDRSWCKRSTDGAKPLLENVVSQIPGDEIFVLQITPMPTDKVYVVDYSPHLHPKYADKDNRDPQIAKMVKQAYWNTRVPLAEYLSGSVAYQVPEVICLTPVPVAQAELVGTHQKQALIAQIRAKGGFLPYAPQPGYEILSELLETATHPEPKKPDKKDPHLWLV